MIHLLHFDQPLHHAKHYLGYTESEEMLPKRLDDHRHGRGARLLAVLRQRGIGWTLAATFPGDRNTERAMKNRKKTSFYCPICRGNCHATEIPSCDRHCG